MTRRTSRRRSSRRLRSNKGFDTVYYWNGKWRAAAPLPPPLGRGETLGEMKAAIEHMGYVAVLGSVARGAPKTPPWRLQQNGTTEEYRGFEIEKVTRAIQTGYDIARIAGTKRPGTRILPVQYLIHYPDGGGKYVNTMKAAREYIDNYLGDA